MQKRDWQQEGHKRNGGNEERKINRLIQETLIQFFYLLCLQI